MRLRRKKTKEIVIPLVTEERDDGSIGVTSPIVPMFYVVGRNQALALDNAMAILKDHLEQNHRVKFREMRLTNYTREVFADIVPTVPAHAIAVIAT